MSRARASVDGGSETIGSKRAAKSLGGGEIAPVRFLGGGLQAVRQRRARSDIVVFVAKMLSFGAAFELRFRDLVTEDEGLACLLPSAKRVTDSGGGAGQR